MKKEERRGRKESKKEGEEEGRKEGSQRKKEFKEFRSVMNIAEGIERGKGEEGRGRGYTNKYGGRDETREVNEDEQER